MNGMEGSDPSIVPTKPTNKAGKPAAEPVEGSGGAKRNAGLQSTNRTQCRETCHRGRHAYVKQQPETDKEKLTALLHHITIDNLRCVFLDILEVLEEAVIYWRSMSSK